MKGSRFSLVGVPRVLVCALTVMTWSFTVVGSAQTPPRLTPPMGGAPAAEDEAPAASEPSTEPTPDTTTEPAPEPTTESAPEPDAELEPVPSEPPPAATGIEDSEPLTLDDVGDEQPSESDPEDWTQPIPVLTLHGYMRVRGEIQDTFWLGRGVVAGDPADPFTPYRSSERAACADPMTTSLMGCDIDTLAYGNMRLRLSPQLNLSDDVRVNMTFDALDNVIAGSGPSSFYDPALGRTYASTLSGGTVVVRRAWAEIRHSNIDLRFGRMPAHWGLGMVQNAGNQLDDDFSTDVDRLMVITKLAGLYLSAAYDFTGEGATRPGPGGVPIDASQRDDVDQYSFSVTQRLSPEEEEDALARGDLTYQAGGMFNYRVQDLAARSELIRPVVEPPAPASDADLVNVNATTYHFDGWGQLKWGGLRVEAEASFVVGSIQDTSSDGMGGSFNLLQFGSALETEFRLLDDKLGLYFYSGAATGDPDSIGLSSGSNFVNQGTSGDDTISTFRFHPSYRVDLILWRNLMQQVTGAYYLKPGISYDFARDPFGQLLGARVDAIWSRAMFSGQTWGGDPNLGVEVNASLYWRGEDGPEIDDGFHAMLQYGILFPMQGLWYRSNVDLSGAGAVKNAAGGLQTAQTVRLVLGVVY